MGRMKFDGHQEFKNDFAKRLARLAGKPPLYDKSDPKRSIDEWIEWSAKCRWIMEIECGHVEVKVKSIEG